MNASDQDLCLLNGEGIYGGAVFLGEFEAFQAGGGTGLAGEVFVAEGEGASERAGAVVIALLGFPTLGGGDLDQLGVDDAFKLALTEVGTPVAVDGFGGRN